MKTKSVWALVASLVINVAAVAAFESSVIDSQRAPEGSVTVSQLPDLSDATRVAQAGR